MALGAASTRCWWSSATASRHSRKNETLASYAFPKCVERKFLLGLCCGSLANPVHLLTKRIDRCHGDRGAVKVDLRQHAGFLAHCETAWTGPRRTHYQCSRRQPGP